MGMLMAIASSVLAFCSVGCMLPIKRGYIRRGVLLISCFLLVSMIIFIGDIVNLPPTLCFFLISILVCCEGTKLQKLTIGLMFGSTAFAYNAILDNIYFHNSDSTTLFRLAFWIFLYLFLRHFAPERNYEMSSALWKLLLFLTCIPFGIVLTIVLMADPNEPLSAQQQRTDYILLFLALISFIGLLRTILVMVKQQTLERKSQLVEMNQKYYETLEEQQFQIRRLKHDMANHLQVLHSLKEAEKNDYIEQLLNTSGVTKAVRYCGEPTINAVLNSKSSAMEEKEVQLYVKIDIVERLPFENADICTIFANALDNAIEYCQKLPLEKRAIHLEAHMQKGMFVMRIVNPCEEKVLELNEHNLPMTSKKDQQQHGIGLGSIRETVKRYDGNMEIQVKDGEFSLFIYMPPVVESI